MGQYIDVNGSTYTHVGFTVSGGLNDKVTNKLSNTIQHLMFEQYQNMFLVDIFYFPRFLAYFIFSTSDYDQTVYNHMLMKMCVFFKPLSMGDFWSYKL